MILRDFLSVDYFFRKSGFMFKQIVLKKIVFVSLLISLSGFVHGADVQISALVDNIDPTTRGGEITYTASVLNGHNDTATNVSLVFPIPATTTFVSVNNGLCSHDGGNPGQVNCALGDMVGDGIGGLITDIDFSILTSGATGNTVAVSSTISADVDSDGTNNTENQNTTINDGADLSLVVTDNPDPAVAGGTITYTIVATNNGPNNAGAALNPNGITVVDTLPVGVSFDSFAGGGWSCNAVAQAVTCTRETINNASSAPDLTIVGNIIGQIAGSVTNSVTISSITSDPQTSNNTVTEDTLITVGTDLSISKAVSSPVIGGTTTSFTLSPRNLGPYDASTVVVTDTLPAGFTFISAVGTGWTCGAVVQAVTCNRATYSVGSTDNIVIQTNVPASGLNIDNTANISSATTDPDNTNNSDTITFSIVPDGADLSLTKTKTPDPVAQGSNMTSLITVSNAGPQATSGVVTVIDILSAGETYVSGSDANWTCNLAGGSPGGTLTCEYQSGNIAASSSAPALTVVTTATNAGLLQNDSSVSDVGGQADGVAGNNSASASVTATAAIADLSIIKTISDNSLDITENSSTYTLTTTNNGPNGITDPGAGAEGVIIRDVIPGRITGVVGAAPGSTGVSVPANVNSNLGASFSCTGTATVVCTLDDGETFANGDFIAVDITVTRPLRDGTSTNTATVTSEVLGDDDSGNNSDNVDLTVAALADVEMLTPSIPVNPAKAGTEATIVLQFRNNGPSTAAGVEVAHVFNPPAGRTYTLISATPTEGTCAPLAGNTLTCSGMTLNRDENRQVTMVVRPGWDGANNDWILEGTTTITTTTPQQNNGDDSKDADLDVVQAELDLLVENNDLVDPVGWAAPPGAFPATLDNIIVYKVDVTNRGPSLATNVLLTYEMTPKVGKDVRFLCDSTNATSCVADASSTCNNLGSTVTGGATLTLSCNIPDNSAVPALNDQELAAGTVTSRYLFFRAETAPDSSGDTHTTMATITSNEDDNLAGNDSEGESTSVRAKVDLGVTKTTPLPIVGILQPFNFTITVVNNGPGDSANSTLADNLPAGMTLTGPPVPSQGSCTGVDGDNSFTCNLQTINNGANAVVTVPVEVAVLGAITNTTTVSSFGVDIDNSNDSDDETVTVVKSSLAGTIYNDLNDDGDQDVGDTAIAGVQVTLTGTAVSGDAINLTTNTDASGDYLFDNLSASSGAGYTLTETQPVGFTDGLESIAGVVIGGSRSTDAITNIAVGINDTLVDYDFAELGRASISGYVWVDENNNGIKENDESNVISNVQINLTGTETVSGEAISLTTNTAANGSYIFVDLRAGTYVVNEIQPIAWADGLESLGDGGGNIGADQFSNIVLATDLVGVNNYNFGELGASLSGAVYQDDNRNGVDDAEPKIAQVTISLTGIDVDGNTVSLSTQTDTAGAYRFDNLPAVNVAGYTVFETHPVDYTDGIDSIGSLGGNVSDDIFKAIPVTAGSNGTLYNFGEGVLLKSSIAGFVYIDKNKDAIKNADELGIENITLSLSGKTLDGYNVAREVVTLANGSYIFEKLGPSDANGYQISEIQPVLFLDGFESIDTLIQTDSDQSDLISAIALGVNQDKTQYNFGELFNSGVSGEVFLDLNDDGLISAEDTGIAGVTIHLTGTDELGSAVDETTQTDINGFYHFYNLAPSDDSGYLLTEIQPVNYMDGADSVEGILLENSRQSDVIQLPKLVAHQVQANNRFAEQYSSSVSGIVFTDNNDDGLVSDDDTGIADVTIHLTGIDELGNEIELTTKTDTNGIYRFDNLAPSNESGYLLTEIQPADYMDGADSVEGMLIENSRQSDVIQLTKLVAHQEQANNLFAEIEGITISGTVWIDENNNGQMDIDEALRIPAVSISLTGIDILDNEIEQNVVTDINGYYEFLRVPRGSYTITEIQPSAWLDGKEQLGNIGGNLLNDAFDNINVIDIENGINYNFGELGSSLQGHVFHDLNDDGVQDQNEAGISEVEIRLTGTDSDGQVLSRVAHTLTNGEYQFTGIPLPDSQGFQVVEIQPEGIDDGKDSLGSHGGILANDMFTNIVFTTHVTEATEYNFAELIRDPATISGVVWLDSNHNRDEDDNNGQAGWIIELIEHNEDPFAPVNLIATVISAADGSYIFDGLSPGLYEVRFRHPQGGTLYGTPVSEHGGADTSNGTIRNLLLHRSEHIIEQNLPIDPTGIVYDSQTREPVAGAIVRIVGPAGFNPSQHLLGGTNNVAQTTAADGLYQFLLFNTAPQGSYVLEVTEAVGYLPGVAPSMPSCNNSLVVGADAFPVLVHQSDSPPVLSSPFHTADNCPDNIYDIATSNQSTQFYLSFEIDPQLPSANVVNNHIPLDPYTNDLINVTKTTSKKNVSRGDLVPYQILVVNSNTFAINGLSLVDQLPPGFRYFQGSAKIDGFSQEPTIEGRNLTWPNVVVGAGQSVTIELITIVGAGVGEGQYINQAWIINPTLFDPDSSDPTLISNIAAAAVRIVPDPLIDCSDVIGKVFEDKNVNGYQDKFEEGIPGVRVASVRGLLVTSDPKGKFHISCAMIPNDMRGSNFILKVDERTLPSGYRITTENPRVTRLTRGKLSKVNFGATLHKVLRMEFNKDAFNNDKLLSQYNPRLEQVIRTLETRPTVIRLAYQRDSETEAIINQRIEHVVQILEDAWQDCDCHYPLIIEKEIFRENTLQDVLPSKGGLTHE